MAFSFSSKIEREKESLKKHNTAKLKMLQAMSETVHER
jgi:hypothetical protein